MKKSRVAKHENGNQVYTESMSIFNDDHRRADNEEDDTPKKDHDETEEAADPGKPSYSDPRIGEDYESIEGQAV